MRLSEESRMFGFRLSGKALAAIEQQAKAHGVSPGDYSRAVVERHLNDDATRGMLEALDVISRRQELLMCRLEEMSRCQELLMCRLEEGLSGLGRELTALREEFHEALKET